MAPERALVTGATGFVGPHLVRELVEHGFEVAAVGRADADVTDAQALRALLVSTRPTHVFHLAGLRDAPLEQLLRVNVLGTANLLSAVAQASQGARVAVVGSSAEYGETTRDPVDEEAPLEPRSDYGVSKASQSLQAAAAAATLGVAVVRLRLFNLVGPGEPPSLVTSAFAAQVAAIESGRATPPIRTGDLTTQRDFVDVRDAVRAIRLGATEGIAGAVYNVCSGRATPINTIVRALLELAELHIDVECTPEPTGGNVRGRRGDPSRLRRQTGWEPQIELRQSLADLLAEHRAALNS